MSRRHRMARSALIAWFTACSVSHLAAAAAGADRWLDVRTFDSFVCYADFDLSDQARLLADLPRLRRDVEVQLRLVSSEEAVELYLFHDRRHYRDFLASRFPGVTPRRAMFVKGRGRGMVFAYRHRELEVDLRHECTHAVLHASVSGLPLWLDEGLAEYFEVPPASRASGHPHLSSLVDTVTIPSEISHPAELDDLQELADLGLDQYRYSWAWVHYLLHGPPEAREELAEFLCDLKSGHAIEPLSRRLERRLPGLQVRLLGHLRASSD